ncbi:MAG: ComEC/Rec2 family competence protein [bacterium]|nr:ComEC/Rec2 family competence protein [bacterium]
MKRYIKAIVAGVLLITFLCGCNADLTDFLIETSVQDNFVEGKTLIVDFFDVGQADCSLIRFPDRRTMLIDTGNSDDGDNISQHLRRLGINTIDFLVLTHPHEDHIGGADDIIEDFNIGKIIMPKISKNDIPQSDVYEELLETIYDENYRITTAVAGSNISESEQYSITCLSPCSDNYGSLNNYSVVLMIQCFDTKFLFTGDAESEIEKELLNKKSDIDADILKVAHHGSNLSTTENFLKRVTPEYSVISCGAHNRYGHPGNKTISRLTEYNSEIFRTDMDGSIRVVCTEDEYSINKNNICLDGDR